MVLLQSENKKKSTSSSSSSHDMSNKVLIMRLIVSFASSCLLFKSFRYFQINIKKILNLFFKRV